MITKGMKTSLMALTLAATAVIMLTTTGLAYADHQPRPDQATDTIDNNLDERCTASGTTAGDASEGRACHGLEKANGAATK